MADLPSPADVAAAHEEYRRVEGRDVVYRVVRDLIERAYRGDGVFTKAEGVAVLLLSWNASFYRPRPWFMQTLVDKLERLIDRHAETITAFRARSVVDYDPGTDGVAVAELYRAFVAHLWPVGAAKALHVLAPGFLPLWDRPIAGRFKLRLSPPAASVAPTSSSSRSANGSPVPRTSPARSRRSTSGPTSGSPCRDGERGPMTPRASDAKWS